MTEQYTECCLQLSVGAIHKHQKCLPWSTPVDIDEKDRDQVARHSASTRIAQHYIFSHRKSRSEASCRYNLPPIVMDLFGDDVMQWAAGKPSKSFFTEIDNFIQKHTHLKAFNIWVEHAHKTFNFAPLKKETIDKCLLAKQHCMCLCWYCYQ